MTVCVYIGPDSRTVNINNWNFHLETNILALMFIRFSKVLEKFELIVTLSSALVRSLSEGIAILLYEKLCWSFECVSQ